MANYLSEYITDLALPPVQRSVPHQLVQGDNDGYKLTALVCDSRTPEMGLLAGNVTGTVLRPDGAEVALVGEKGELRQVGIPQRDGSTLACNATPCNVTLPQSAFTMPGRVVIVVKLTSGSTITQVLNVTAVVLKTATGTIIDPGTVIPEPGELYWIAQEAQAAAEEAEAAAQHAVRYDEEQDLTEAQQATARGNVDAASAQDVADLDETKADKTTVNALSTTVFNLERTVNTLGSSLSSEIAARTAGDNALNTAKADRTELAEVSDAVDGLVETVTDLSGTVTQEIADREAADAALDAAKASKQSVTDLSATVDVQGLRISGLQTQIDTEASARQAADTALGGQISVEAAARANGDTSTLSTAEAYADGIVSTEATARASGDANTLAAAKTYADGLVVTDAVRTSAQTLTDAQKRQARENISAEEASAVEIIPATDGYIRLDAPATDTTVAMSGGVPVITQASGSALKPYHSLIEVQEGEQYSISCRGASQYAAGMLVLAENGTILDRQAGSAATSFTKRVVTIPNGAKWLYVVVNRATSSTARGTENRFWAGAYTPVRVTVLEGAVDTLEATKQDAAVTETVSGATATITAQDNRNYICGTVTELTITAPATGLFSVRWTAGENLVLTLTGITMPEWWTSCESGRVYELNVKDGYGVVMSWATT